MDSFDRIGEGTQQAYLFSLYLSYFAKSVGRGRLHLCSGEGKAFRLTPGLKPTSGKLHFPGVFQSVLCKDLFEGLDHLLAIKC